ncbi:PREDICTED: uncharacterized protein LOC109326381 [Lupinus angustifolius]|uniref:uncharacterized protein LOC109326381 n=1 Tax=Lupinus angustifolius TaxID=3871 RepID=UPI00092EC9E6|nr:PREDICTED: uncharacterized protein LOC109326381 [Lupinus angustifolius]
MMESLELSRVLLLTSSLSLSLIPPTTKTIRQLGFRSLVKKANKYANLRLTRSFSGHTGNGAAHAASQGKGEDEMGLLLAREIDEFGSIVGFNLIPGSGKITEDATSNEVEVPEARGVEEHKVQARVSYSCRPTCFPDIGWVKINVDGSCSLRDQSIRGGGVIRNEDGIWLSGFSINFGTGSSILAELLAIECGLTLAWNLGHRKVILKSDCLEAIHIITVRMQVRLDRLSEVITSIGGLLKRNWDLDIAPM